MVLETISDDRSSDIPNFLDWSLSDHVPECRSFDPCLDYTAVPFVQPDGTSIGLSYPSRGKRYIHFTANQRFQNYKPFANKHKDHSKCHAKMELWAGPPRKQFLICVDFDRLPKELYQQVRIWGSSLVTYPNPHEIKNKGCKILVRKLQERIGNNGVVFNSVGNHYPKILIPIEYDSRVNAPTRQDIIALLHKLLPEFMEENCIDLQKVALSTTYFPWEERDTLRQKITNLSPIAIKKTAHTVVFRAERELITIPVTFRYLQADTLPNALKQRGDSLTYCDFLRCLCAMPHLARDGYAISQVAMARTLGVRQTTISKYIQKACREGILEVVNDEYIPNIRAKRYRAKGKLKEFLISKINKQGSIIKPKKIKDGEWHGVMINVAKAFKHDPDGFLSWVKTIPGWDKKDRFYQAQNIRRWILKKRSAEPIPLAVH